MQFLLNSVYTRLIPELLAFHSLVNLRTGLCQHSQKPVANRRRWKRHSVVCLDGPLCNPATVPGVGDQDH